MERPSAPVPAPGPGLHLRRARFEEVPDILRLIERAVEEGCRLHYGPAQRRAIVLTYARYFFVEVQAGGETFVAELDGRLAAVAQFDPATERLRGLFVDAPAQSRGVGTALLALITARAAACGCSRLHGAMSLNAAAFYRHAGFRRCDGPGQLIIDGLTVPVLPMQMSLSRPLS